MTTRNPGGDDHAYWRRPATEAGDASAGPTAPGAPGSAGAPPGAAQPAGTGQAPGAAQPAGAGEPPAYTGPPPTEPPPPGYRTPHVIRPAPPRTLPAQDLAGLDEAERAGRTLTLGIGMIAGAIVLILGCLLCSRLLF